MRTKKVRTIEWLLKNYANFFYKFGINEIEILKRYETFQIKKSGVIEDFLWGLFNYIIIENSKNANSLIELYKNNHCIYLEMVSFRRKYEKKKENRLWKFVIENALKRDIENLSSHRLQYAVEIITCDDCESCHSIKGKIISVEEALNNKTIPYDTCSRDKGCCCDMILIAKREA